MFEIGRVRRSLDNIRAASNEDRVAPYADGVRFALAVGYIADQFAEVEAHVERARRLRKLEPMVTVDVAALCGLQFLSTGSYLVLGLLAFLPFFIATQTGARAAVASIGAIIAGAVAVVADPTFRKDLSALEILTLLSMLGLLCLCSYTVSRVQQRRLISVAELTASRSLLLADVMSAEERERGRIAEALHDGALQTLLVARQDLRDVLRGKDPSGVERASELVADVSEELRQVTRELHPAVLHEAGLGAAVTTLAQTFTERTGVPVELVVDYPFSHPDDAMLYGVARELLNKSDNERSGVLSTAKVVDRLIPRLPGAPQGSPIAGSHAGW